MRNKKKESKSMTRRNFIKASGAVGFMAAMPTAMLKKVLDVRTALAEDNKLILQAINIVDANARNKRPELSILASYRRLGGANADVFAILGLVDTKLKQNNAFRSFNQLSINKLVEDGITEYLSAHIAVAKGKSDLYNVPDSAARLMFERGGTSLRNLLNSNNIRIVGFNK